MEESQTQQTSTISTAPTTNGAAPDWRAGIDPELAKDPNIASFKTANDFAKSHIELRKTVGSSIRVPGPDATPEERDKFYAKLGRPEAPDKYELKRPDLPAEVVWDEKLEGSFKTAAHSVGLNSAQAQALLDWYSGQTKGSFEGLQQTQQQAAEATRAALETEWGHNFAPNMTAAKNAVVHLGGQELMDALDRTGAGNDPVIIRAFAKFGSNLKTAGLIKGDPSSPDGDAGSAEAEIQAIRADINHPKNPLNSKLTSRQQSENSRYMSALVERKNRGKQ